jgi:SP family xylose:H+ symportor-like MFS transporter
VIVAGILLSVFQQFVGINAVLYYAPLMFKNLGASTDSALGRRLLSAWRTSLSPSSRF